MRVTRGVLLALVGCQSSQQVIDAAAAPPEAPPPVARPAPQRLETARALERQQVVAQEPPPLAGPPSLIGLFRAPAGFPTVFDTKNVVVAEVSVPAEAFAPAAQQSVSALLLRPDGATEELFPFQVLFVDPNGRELSARELEAPVGPVRGCYLFEAPGFVRGFVTWRRDEVGAEGRQSTKPLRLSPRARRSEKAIALEALRPGRWALVTRFENADAPVGGLFLRVLDAAGEEPQFVHAWVLDAGALLEPSTGTPDGRRSGEAVYLFEAADFTPTQLIFEERHVPLPPIRRVLSARARAMASEAVAEERR